jgi:YegS/Rv2252/BmrU family lipid kinase
MTHSLLIINPTSARGKAGAAREAVVRELEKAGPVDVVVSSAPGEAEKDARRAAEGAYRRVIAAGGDGTINEVVNGLAGSDVELGIIALGTGNVLARELGLPIHDIPSAAAVIRTGLIRRIDLARADSRYYAAMAGFGFDAAVVDRIVPRIKDFIGAGAYAFAIARELMSHKPARFSLDLDGEALETEASVVVVANSASYAYGIKVAPRASLDDGWLDVIIFEKAKPVKLALVHQALRVVMRTHMSDPNIRFLRARRVRVETEPSVLVQLDGDVAGATPTQIEVVPKSLSVIVGS